MTSSRVKFTFTRMLVACIPEVMGSRLGLVACYSDRIELSLSYHLP